MRPPSDSPLRRLRSVRIAFLCALLATLTGACGGSITDPGALWQRVLRTEAERPWDAGASELVRKLEVPDGLAPWSYTADTVRVRDKHPLAQGSRMVGLAGKGPKELHVPLDGRVGSFNEVRFKLLIPGHASVAAEVRANGRLQHRSPFKLVLGNHNSQVMTIGLPGARTLSEAPDELVIRVHGGIDRVSVWDVELRRRPWESWAADIGGETGRPVIGDVSREGDAIATDNPRSVDLAVEEGYRLSFHYAGWPVLGLSDVDARIVVRVEADGARVEESFAIPDVGENRPRWRHATVDLGTLGEGRARATFSLESEGELQNFALLSTLAVYSPKADPRTVLFVTSDTHRGDHVARAGKAVAVRTPSLDALADRGVIFDDCYSSTNITLPSHISLMTAVPPRDTGVLDNMSGVTEEATTLAECFRDRGWATLASVSVSQLQDEWSGLGQGFSGMAFPTSMVWEGGETAQRLKVMMQDVEDRDLFVWLHLFDAHHPYEVEEGLLAGYYPSDRDPFDPSLPEPSFPSQSLPEDLKELRDDEFMNARYKGEVTYVDNVLGSMFSLERVRDGWIAVTADHGECLGEYRIWWDHAGLYPQNLHVPLILAGPGVPSGKRVRGPVQHLDLGRTLLDLAGLEDVAFPGRSMLRHLDEDPPSDTPRFALASRGKIASVEMDGWFCVVTLEAWKPHGADEAFPEHLVELFHLHDDDPQADVSSQHLERSRRMRAMVLDWLADQRDTGWVQQDLANNAERIEQVRALGYTAETTDVGSFWIDPECECGQCSRFSDR